MDPYLQWVGSTYFPPSRRNFFRKCWPKAMWANQIIFYKSFDYLIILSKLWVLNLFMVSFPQAFQLTGFLTLIPKVYQVLQRKGFNVSNLQFKKKKFYKLFKFSIVWDQRSSAQTCMSSKSILLKAITRLILLKIWNHGNWILIWNVEFFFCKIDQMLGIKMQLPLIIISLNYLSLQGFN